MNVEWLHGTYTVLALVTFVVIGVWAWSARNKAAFDEAAHVPFLDDDMLANQAPAARENKT